VLVRREIPSDIAAVRLVVAAAFARDPRTGLLVQGEPVEVGLLDQLRASDAWVPALSWVVVDGGAVIGHGVCTRAEVGSTAVVALGPIGVEPQRQGAGVGSALVHALLGAADALEVPLVALLGDPAYYGRFGFRSSTDLGVLPPDPAWGRHFQARALSAHDDGLRGTFRYAQPFADLE
jgi:putative acetyltransferase